MNIESQCLVCSFQGLNILFGTRLLRNNIVDDYSVTHLWKWHWIWPVLRMKKLMRFQNRAFLNNSCNTSITRERDKSLCKLQCDFVYVTSIVMLHITNIFYFGIKIQMGKMQMTFVIYFKTFSTTLLNFVWSKILKVNSRFVT